jgi:hypothetical protein
MADSAALQVAAQIVESHLTEGKSGPITTRLVEYGIALRQGLEGHIVEPLAFLSLMRWLQTLDHANLEVNIRSRLAFISKFDPGLIGSDGL